MEIMINDKLKAVKLDDRNYTYLIFKNYKTKIDGKEVVEERWSGQNGYFNSMEFAVEKGIKRHLSDKGNKKFESLQEYQEFMKKEIQALAKALTI